MDLKQLLLVFLGYGAALLPLMAALPALSVRGSYSPVVSRYLSPLLPEEQQLLEAFQSRTKRDLSVFNPYLGRRRSNNPRTGGSHVPWISVHPYDAPYSAGYRDYSISPAYYQAQHRARSSYNPPRGWAHYDVLRN